MANDCNEARRLYLGVSDRILGLICVFGLESGQRLPSEKNLAKRLNTSRSVLREALTALEVEGRIISRRGNGRVVNHVLRHDDFALVHALDPAPEQPSLRGAIAVFQARYLLEPRVAEMAAQRATPETIGRIERLLGKMLPGSATDSEFLEYDARFHVSLAEATGNRAVMGVAMELQRLWHGARQGGDQDRHFRGNTMFGLTIQEHRDILDAVRDGCDASARERMCRHLKTEWRWVFPESQMDDVIP